MSSKEENNNKLPQSDAWDELATLLNKKYKVQLDDKSFSVSAKMEEGVVSVTVVLKNKDESFYYPVEARVKHIEEELSPGEALYFLVDYIDTYFEEYLTEDDNIYLPIDWASFEYEAVSFELKGQILNRKADLLADQLLSDLSTSDDAAL